MNPIIIPLHNNCHLSKAALRSCLAQDIEGGVEVFLLNDASTDATPQWLNSITDPRVVVTHFPSPVGVTPLWNFALTWTLVNNPHALVINNDVELRPDTYRLLAGDGGGFVTGVPVSDRGAMETGRVDNRIPHPSFSCFLIRQDVWRRVGQFDPSMVFVAQDGDYHLRMDALGIDAYALELPFYHVTSATIKHAEPGEKEALCKRCDADRAAFTAKWGMDIGSEAYYKRFREWRENKYVTTGRL